MKMSGKVAALALAATVVAQPAQACWTNAESDAAQVANLNMMMMVSALRCRNGPDNFLNEYNRFVSTNNPVLGAQNDAMRRHFARINGPKGAEAAMDKFVIGIANNYGGGHENLDCTQLKAIAIDLANNGHSASSLLSIADASVENIPLPGGVCSISIASK
jgi:hypothetical protein